LFVSYYIIDISANMSANVYWTSERTRQLITLVYHNEDLYSKNKQMFKNKQAKTLTWESIGTKLFPPCTGKISYFFLHLIQLCI